MGFWPFGGSKKNKQSRTGEKPPDFGRDSSTPDTMARGEKQAHGPAERPSRTNTRTNSRQQQHEKASKLVKKVVSDPRSSSRIASRSQTASPAVGYPTHGLTDSYDSGVRSESSRQGDVYHHDIRSDSSLGPDNFSAARPIPTLRAKRSDYNPAMPRRKSSKRKAEDHAREREVRAMSSPIPVPQRPTTYSEGLLARETRKVPGDLNRKLARPMSNVSLPLPESFAEMETASNVNSFKVSPFSVLAPRPTIRYDTNPRSGPSPREVHSRLSVQQAVMEEEWSASTKRIDDLADNLDSGSLRELLERDRKRRERKREDDKSKLQRKLQRRAERQKEEETGKAQIAAGSPSTPVKNQGRNDRDPALLPDYLERSPTGARADGDVEMQGTTPESKGARRDSSDMPDPFADLKPRVVKTNEQIRNPFEDEKEIDDTHDPFADQEDDEPKLPVRSPLRETRDGERQSRPPQPNVSPPTSPLQEPINQQSVSATAATPEQAQSDRQESEQSAQPVSSWTNFFRRGGGKRKSSASDHGAAGFTNTSRDSLSRQQPPPSIPPRSFKRSSTPQRTQSKFREDLPELPISPPDSRVQSPDAEIAHQPATLPLAGSTRPSQSISGASDVRSLATSTSMSALDRNRAEQRLSEQRPTDVPPVEAGPSGAGLSTSLASVDSEGSWLSGKPVKRGSQQLSHPLRQSQSSIQAQAPGTFVDDEGDGVADDEFLNRLAPAPEERRSSSGSAIRKASSTAIDLRGEQDRSTQPELPPLPDLKDEKWHGSVGKQPTVVRQPSRAKSKEGLLKDYTDDMDDSGGDDDGESPDAEIHDADFQDSPIMRARSVEYGRGHARHISAGSARLLDITRRASVQSENRPPGDRSSTAIASPSTTN